MEYDWDLAFTVIQSRFGYTPDQIRRLTFYQFFVVCLKGLKRLAPKQGTPTKAGAPQHSTVGEQIAAVRSGALKPMSWNSAVAKINAIRDRKKAEGLI